MPGELKKDVIAIFVYIDTVIVIKLEISVKEYSRFLKRIFVMLFFYMQKYYKTY